MFNVSNEISSLSINTAARKFKMRTVLPNVFEEPLQSTLVNCLISKSKLRHCLLSLLTATNKGFEKRRACLDQPILT